MSTVHEQLEASVALERRKEMGIAQGNPSTVLEMAMSRDANIETLTRLLELQERWEANEARKAFHAAMAAFKANPPKVVKRKPVSFGGTSGTSYKHATLDDASELIGDALSHHGLSHRWDVQQNADNISVSCVLTHSLGHSERVTMQSLPDKSGSKNSIQAIGSAVTYLQRYTLFAATGIAPEGDDDGNGGDKKKMDRDEFDRYSGLISSAESLQILDAKYKAACADAGEDVEAKREFKKLAGTRYKELGGQ